MGRVIPIALLMCGVAVCAGCAQQQRPVTPTTAATTLPTTHPTGLADLTLDQIEPRPLLGRPSTQPTPTDPPSVEALELYARARDALTDNQRPQAISLLERAVALDPRSFELHHTLAKAYRSAQGTDPRAMEQLEKAAALEPDHLDVQVELGREYLTKGSTADALRHLRLALQTSQYKFNDARAVEADLFLSHALQAMGYDRAALQQYEHLLARLNGRDAPRGANPEMATQVAGRLYQTVGDLYVRQGQADKALAAYEQAGKRVDDFDIRARVIRTLLVLGRNDDAKSRAADAVARFHASPEAVALLRDVYRILGHEAGAIDQLQKLHAQKPADRDVLFALCELLKADGRNPEVARLLAEAAKKSPGDAAIFLRRLQSQEADRDLLAAAKVWIESVAVSPDLVCQSQEFWVRTLRPENRAKLKPQDVAGLSLADSARGAKAYALWRIESLWPRHAAARAALEQAVAARPAFAPAFRERLEEIGDDSTLSPETRAAESQNLIAAAQKSGDAALAAELRGRLLMKQGDAPGGASALADAVRLARPAGPELRLAFGLSLLSFNDAPGFERAATNLVTQCPTFAVAQVTLYDYYRDRGSAEAAERIIRGWRRAEPQGLAVRLLEARDLIRISRLEPAESLFIELFSLFGDDSSVLSGLEIVATRNNHVPQLIARLEDRLTHQPNSFHASVHLADLYLSAKRPRDAARILAAARSAAAAEPDVLYSLSHLYARAGDKETSAQVLKQVLQLDPSHSSASNDLGYLLAEDGRNLDEAEGLVRSAAKAEPENRSVLDSLGWILYKRGKFDEARQVLERAVGEDVRGTATPATEPSTLPPSRPADESSDPKGADPVVLDHMGDVMYRLDDREAAGWYWTRSRLRLAEWSVVAADREDLQPLGVLLQKKQEQLRAGEPVSVSPVVEPSPSPPVPVDLRGAQR